MSFLEERVAFWNVLKEKYPKKEAGEKIVMVLPDGAEQEGVAFETKPVDIAKRISNGLAKQTVVAKVDGEYWDAWRPLEKSGKLEFFKFGSPEGKHAFWHSAAHVLGAALEAKYQCHLCIGPPLEDGGFYYEASMDKSVTMEDYEPLNQLALKVVAEDAPFERLDVAKEDALELFKGNKYKQEIIGNKIPDGGTASIYRCGPLIDLCRGPHVSSTGKIKAFEVTKNSSSYWLGNAANDTLQRVYGIAFPTPKEMKAHKRFLEEAAKRDHRKIGVAQQLFFMHPYSPGSPFFLPHGMRILNKLYDMLRFQYRKRGYDEVLTPNVFRSDLWKCSGHWDNYKDDMFTLKGQEDEEFALKPMNCPGHCVVFKAVSRSYRELPLRFAEFGVLHRNEASGALTGLTRVRRFVQDDAHIFCTVEQIEAEILGCINFLLFVYEELFDFKVEFELSTRPENKLGADEMWDIAEKALEDVLVSVKGKEWELNPGDGAFYGPKIDIHIRDALNRSHQCATVQLDFQLPDRFGLQYRTNEESLAQPVLIHRAILGSFERFIAVAIEHLAGKWPFWLSPRQAIVLPVMPAMDEYAIEVKNQLHAAGFHVDVDLSPNKINKKVREAQLGQYNYILVVGKTEMENQSVNVRTRDNVVHGEKPIKDILAELEALNRIPYV